MTTLKQLLKEKCYPNLTKNGDFTQEIEKANLEVIECIKEWLLQKRQERINSVQDCPRTCKLCTQTTFDILLDELK